MFVKSNELKNWALLDTSRNIVQQLSIDALTLPEI